jgi:pyridoxine/pyridoxamine 5'-phosphate oxidase
VVAGRLAEARNFWLCTASPERGPYARPVWALWSDDGLLFTSSRTSRKARDFLADPRVTVHVELLREVVVLDGVVEETQPDESAVAAYGAKYGWTPPDSQQWFLVRPRRGYAAIESSYPEQATDFRF